MSFRADGEDVAAADAWARRLGVDRSELLRDALAAHLARLSVESDAAAYETIPFTDEETMLDAADDWGPAENWAEWVDRRDRPAG